LNIFRFVFYFLGDAMTTFVASTYKKNVRSLFFFELGNRTRPAFARLGRDSAPQDVSILRKLDRPDQLILEFRPDKPDTLGMPVNQSSFVSFRGVAFS
jgi:hypothetical protein